MVRHPCTLHTPTVCFYLPSSDSEQTTPTGQMAVGGVWNKELRSHRVGDSPGNVGSKASYVKQKQVIWGGGPDSVMQSGGGFALERCRG